MQDKMAAMNGALWDEEPPGGFFGHPSSTGGRGTVITGGARYLS